MSGLKLAALIGLAVLEFDCGHEIPELLLQEYLQNRIHQLR